MNATQKAAIAGAAGLALLWLVAKGPTAKGKGRKMVPGEWLPSTPPNDQQRRVWESIRRLAVGVPHVTVTSGTRTHRAQAKAMRKKVELYGRGALDIYPSSIREAVFDAVDTLDGWTAAIERLAAAGVTVSRHHAGRALDLRIRDLTADQRQALQVAADKAVGLTGKTLMEQDHLHVQW